MTPPDIITRYAEAFASLTPGNMDRLMATVSADVRFKRMWELYLSYCEGGFRAGMIDVKQLLFVHNRPTGG